MLKQKHLESLPIITRLLRHLHPFSSPQSDYPSFESIPLPKRSELLDVCSLGRKVAGCNLHSHADKYSLDSSWKHEIDHLNDILLFMDDKYFSNTRVSPLGEPFTLSSPSDPSAPCPLCWWPMGSHCHCNQWNNNLPQWFIETRPVDPEILKSETNVDIFLFHPAEWTSPSNTGHIIPFSHNNICTLFPTALQTDTLMLEHFLMRTDYGLLFPSSSSIPIPPVFSESTPLQPLPTNFILFESSWQNAKRLRRLVKKMPSKSQLESFELVDIPFQSLSRMRKQTVNDRVTTIEAYMLLQYRTNHSKHPLSHLRANFQNQLQDFLTYKTNTGMKDNPRINEGTQLLENFDQAFPPIPIVSQ